MINHTITSEPGSLSQLALEELKASLRRRIFQPGDHGYNQARTIRNWMVDDVH